MTQKASTIVPKSKLESVWNEPYKGGSTLKQLNTYYKNLKEYRFKVTVSKQCGIFDYKCMAASDYEAESLTDEWAKREFGDGYRFSTRRV